LAKFSSARLFARALSIFLTLGAVLYGIGANVLMAQERQTATTATRGNFTINEVLAKNSRKTNKSANERPTQLGALDLSALPDVDPWQQNAASQQSQEPFGLVTFRAPEELLWAQWRKLSAELETDARVLSQCQADMKQCASPAARKYLALIKESRNLSDRAKIDRINRAINAAIAYTTDRDQYGVVDLWSAPLVTLSAGRGDCEDYAIAKYVALHEAGISTDDLRILFVYDRVARGHHAVVGVRENGHWLMLDNRHEVVIEQKDAWYFSPLYALDQHGVKLFARPFDNPPATSAITAGINPANLIVPATTERNGNATR
jgi:predicted transglutaminase-like cysteine proteinase